MCMMDALSRNNMNGNDLVMDNAAMHTPVKIHDLVGGRDYIYLYLPLYSLFLNAIEKRWSKNKG